MSGVYTVSVLSSLHHPLIHSLSNNCVSTFEPSGHLGCCVIRLAGHTFMCFAIFVDLPEVSMGIIDFALLHAGFNFKGLRYDIGFGATIQ